MDETDKKPAPKSAAALKPTAKVKADDRQARLAEQLRANLRRRKSQARDRKDSGES